MINARFGAQQRNDMLHTTPIFPDLACPAPPGGSWLEIVYDASLIEDAKRPALVFTHAAGDVQREHAPAPVLGRAIWIGRVPPGVSAVHLESHQTLRLTSVTRRGLWWRLWRALRRHKRHAAAALALACLGHTARARKRLARALTESPLDAYGAWAVRRRRPHEPDGIDKPTSPLPPGIDVSLAPGETLTPWALDAVSAAFAADLSLSALQGDSEIVEASSWSAGFVSAWTPARGAVFTRAGSEGASVRRVRTILTRHPARTSPPPPQPHDPDAWPGVTVIVPTRDRLDLLRTCVTGVLTGTDYPNVTLIIADNDSAEAETRAYLPALAAEDARVRVVACPGPFNFSAINNRAAAQSDSALLAFLNNDIAIKDSGWLKALVRQALAPGTGAVGATLLYENGRIQHAGVALGPGGTAGHVLRDKSVSALAGISGTRRVSAVTGACLVVDRAKFDAVGGFDEAFPVDYNDIDLCLRLNARGWGTVWSPGTMLIHRESASRRKGHINLEAVALFRSRWAAEIADDPYFHPAFSENALDLSLG